MTHTDAAPSATAQDAAGQRRAAMRRADELCRTLVAPLHLDVRRSILGPEWSHDLDIDAGERADEVIDGARRRGWLDLGPVLRHLGWSDEGTSFAIREDDRLLARVDISTRPPGATDPVARTLRHIARHGPDERRCREVAAYFEAGMLDPAEHPELTDLTPAPGDRQTVEDRSLRRRLKRLAPEPKVRIAVSGVDGSGKSTLTSALAEALGRCAFSTTVVWTRPGMNLRLLDAIARRIKRRDTTTSGLARLASGEDAEVIASRRPLIGWCWTLLVTCAYIVDIRRRLHRASGVVIFDRHLADAEATLAAFYPGVDVRLQQKLVRACIPRADVTAHLRVTAEEAHRRKPDDMIGSDLLDAQLHHYRLDSRRCGTVLRVEQRRSPDATAGDVLETLTGHLNSRRVGPTAQLMIARRRRRGGVRRGASQGVHR